MPRRAPCSHRLRPFQIVPPGTRSRSRGPRVSKNRRSASWRITPRPRCPISMVVEPADARRQRRVRPGALRKLSIWSGSRAGRRRTHHRAMRPAWVLESPLCTRVSRRAPAARSRGAARIRRVSAPSDSRSAADAGARVASALESPGACTAARTIDERRTETSRRPHRPGIRTWRPRAEATSARKTAPLRVPTFAQVARHPAPASRAFPSSCSGDP